MEFRLEEIRFSKEEIYSAVYHLPGSVSQLINHPQLYSNAVRLEEGRVLLDAESGQLKLVVKELENKTDAKYQVYLNYFVPNGYKNYRSVPKYMKSMEELEKNAKELVFGLGQSA